LAIKQGQNMRKNNTGLKGEQFSSILNSITDGVFTIDKNWQITSFNNAAQQITGVSEEEAIGSSCCDVFKASICETDCALRQTIETENR